MENPIRLNHEQVLQILPHRPPMLMVDEITSCVPMERIEGTLYINPEWELFKGHFPGDPIFPGVLSVEAMAQTVNIMLMTAERYAGKVPLFAAIDQVKFRRKILPGQTAVMRAEVVQERPEKAMITSRAALYVDDVLAAEALLTEAMR